MQTKACNMDRLTTTKMTSRLLRSWTPFRSRRASETQVYTCSKRKCIFTSTFWPTTSVKRINKDSLYCQRQELKRTAGRMKVGQMAGKL